MQMPEAECFLVTNLKYMRWFWQVYAPVAIGPQVGEELDSPIFHVPWGHHKYIIDKLRKDPDKAMFYVREVVKNGWSRAVLMHFMDTSLYERQGKAVSNFAVTLPEPDSDLAQEVTKDPYCFDFVALTPKYREKELKDAMMAGFASARRRTTRWSNGHSNPRSSPSAFPSLRFRKSCPRKSPVTSPASRILNPRSKGTSCDPLRNMAQHTRFHSIKVNSFVEDAYHESHFEPERI